MPPEEEIPWTALRWPPWLAVMSFVRVIALFARLNATLSSGFSGSRLEDYYGRALPMVRATEDQYL